MRATSAFIGRRAHDAVSVVRGPGVVQVVGVAVGACHGDGLLERSNGDQNLARNESS